MSLILTLGLMIIGAALAGIAARKLNQPMILGYVVAGLLLGPTVTGVVSEPEPVALLSELGLVFLMFIIGLELDLTKLHNIGMVSVLIGAIQVVVTATIAAGVAAIGPFTFIQGLYLGLLIAFSSTLIVVKVLADRHELSSTHGELAIGILIVQDILAVVGLTLLGALDSSGPLPGGLPTLPSVLAKFSLAFPQTGWGIAANLLISGTLFALCAWLFFRLIIPRVSRSVSASSELFFVSTLAAVFIVSLLAGFFSFSTAIGAFVAGVALSSSLHSHDIMGRVKPLRDFFLILFFVSLGLQVGFKDFLSGFWLILFILIGALALKPAVTFFTLRLFRYSNRTSFLAGLHLAQVGEFGLILVSAGVLSGALPASALTAAVLTTVFTMTLTVYAMRYDERLYQSARPWLRPLNRFFPTRAEEMRSVPAKYAPEVVIFGVNRTTSDAIELFTSTQKRRLLLVDANSHRLATFRERGIPVFCTDAINEELYEQVDLSKAQLAISAVSGAREELHGPDPNVYLLRKLRAANPHIISIVTAPNEEQGRRLYKAGATLVLVTSLIDRKMLHNLLADGNLDQVRSLGKSYEHEINRQFMFLKK